jgi:nucleoside-diphosphate-sugar epimerase
VRILVTGHQGYIGAVLVPLLMEAKHEVIGLDTGLFADCTYAIPAPQVPTIRKDIREISSDDLNGIQAIIHLAGVSFGGDEFSARLAYEINYRGTLQLASLAKFAGVRRFVCLSSYDGSPVDERVRNADELFRKGVAYVERFVAQSTEEDVRKLASSAFAPVFLRCNSVYGFSPMMRLDLPLNQIAASVILSGEAYVPIDGEVFHPGAHVQDVSNAILAVLQAPHSMVYAKAFDLRDIGGPITAEALTDHLRDILPECRVTSVETPVAPFFAAGAFDYASDALPYFQPRWGVREGLMQLFEAFVTYPLSPEEVTSGRFQRQEYAYYLIKEGRLDAGLRWFDATRPKTPFFSWMDSRQGTQTTRPLNI